MESVTRKPYARQLELERVTLRELIDTCLRNCANSYRVLAIESATQPIPQLGTMMKSVTVPSHETYVANVLELAVHIPTSWRNDAIKKEEEKIEKEGSLNHVLFTARRLHHAIIELLIERKDLETVKIPRTLID